MSKVIGKMSAGIGYTMQSMKNATSNCKVDGKVCSKENALHTRQSARSAVQRHCPE